MNKIVTYQSPEYFELLALGWVIVAQVGASTVMMSHEGTGYSERGGMPQENTDPSWAPIWGGIPGPPYVYDWVEITHSGLSPQNEISYIYKDLNSYDAAYPDLYRFTKIDVEHAGVVFWSEIFYERYTDMLFEFNWRAVTPLFDTWTTISNGTVGAVTVGLQYLTPSSPGSIQYRITYTPPGTIHLHDTWTALINEWIISGAH